MDMGVGGRVSDGEGQVLFEWLHTRECKFVGSTAIRCSVGRRNQWEQSSRKLSGERMATKSSR